MSTITHQEIPRVTREAAEAVALSAYAQLFDLLDQLDPTAWAARTDCEAWDVDDMVGHLIGAARSNASMRELARQQLWGRRRASEFDGNSLDAVNQLQVRDHAGLAPREKLDELRAIAPRAAHERTHMPRILRGVRLPMAAGAGSTMPGTQPTITMGQLNEVIYTRDIWLHTVDIERATGVDADRSGDIDRTIVHDAVADWMDLHGQPVTLELTGPAGGTFSSGTDGQTITIDAIEWARTVSGRVPGGGLLAQPVVF